MSLLLEIIQAFLIALVIIEQTDGNPLQVWEQNPCVMPQKPGPCDGHFRRFAFNARTKNCEEFVFGGCEGNTNNFENPEKCQQMCGASSQVLTIQRDPLHREATCSMPRIVGPCAEMFPRYHYNWLTKTCEEFIFGGCQGNENNFMSADDCTRYCGAKNVRFLHPSPADGGRVCNEDGKVFGGCMNSKPRFSYNNRTMSCEEFLYSGCGGSDNNFVHGDECSRMCRARTIAYLDGTTMHPRAPYHPGQNSPPRSGMYSPMDWIIPIHPICLLPRVPGHCGQQRQPSYSFNPMTRRCERFIFGYNMCNGNENNFYTATDCMRTCPAIDVVDVL